MNTALTSAPEPFDPPAYLSNAHLQTLLAGVRLRKPWIDSRAAALDRASERLLVPAGPGIRLVGYLARHGTGSGPVRPLAVLIHGWLGCHQSLYLRSCAAELFNNGFNVFRLNLRDHGGSEALNRELFHSCRIDEVVAALVSVQERTAAAGRVLGGFSLGGNFALRVAARCQGAGLEYARIAAVSPVLDPAATLVALEQGWIVYRHYFLRRWRHSIRRKQQAFPDDYREIESGRGMGLGEMTEYLACRYAGFQSLQRYLSGYAVVGDALSAIAAPTTIIASADDPVNPGRDLARLARPAELEIELQQQGGHCGFVDRVREPSWADRRMLSLFRAAVSGRAGRRPGAQPN